MDGDDEVQASQAEEVPLEPLSVQRPVVPSPPVHRTQLVAAMPPPTARIRQRETPKKPPVATASGETKRAARGAAAASDDDGGDNAKPVAATVAATESKLDGGIADAEFDDISDDAIVSAIDARYKENDAKITAEALNTILPCRGAPLRTAVGLSEATGAAMDKAWYAKCIYPPGAAARIATTEGNEDDIAVLAARFDEDRGAAWFEHVAPHRLTVMSQTVAKANEKAATETKKKQDASGAKPATGSDADKAKAYRAKQAAITAKAGGASGEIGSADEPFDPPKAAPPLTKEGRPEFVNVYNTAPLPAIGSDGIPVSRDKRVIFAGPPMLVHRGTGAYGDWAQAPGQDKNVHAKKDLSEAQISFMCYVDKEPYEMAGKDGEGKLCYPAVNKYKSWMDTACDCLLGFVCRNNAAQYVHTLGVDMKAAQAKAADDEFALAFAAAEATTNPAEKKAKIKAAEERLTEATNKKLLLRDAVAQFKREYYRAPAFSVAMPGGLPGMTDVIKFECPVYVAHQKGSAPPVHFMDEVDQRMWELNKVVRNNIGIYQLKEGAFVHQRLCDVMIPPFSLVAPVCEFKVVQSPIHKTYRFRAQLIGLYLYQSGLELVKRTTVCIHKIPLKRAREFGHAATYDMTSGWSAEKALTTEAEAEAKAKWDEEQAKWARGVVQAVAKKKARTE